MIHGYSTERPGAVFTHVVGFDSSIMEEMEKHSYRFDSDAVKGSASFMHFTAKERDVFVEKFKILLVETKKDLAFVKKLII